MFRDLPNVEIVEINTQRSKTLYPFVNFFSLGRRRFHTIKKIYDVDFESGIPSEYQFYKIADVPFRQKWDSFYVERDYGAEKRLESLLKLPERYIFLHDDNRYPVHTESLPSSIPVVRAIPGLTENAFDYRGIIERASEVHVIDSSFMFLVDCLDYEAPNQKLFIHRYARPNANWNLPILKKPWTILT